MERPNLKLFIMIMFVPSGDFLAMLWKYFCCGDIFAYFVEISFAALIFCNLAGWKYLEAIKVFHPNLLLLAGCHPNQTSQSSRTRWQLFYRNNFFSKVRLLFQNRAPVNQTAVLTWKVVAIIKFIEQFALEAKDAQIEQRKIDVTKMAPIWLKFV